MDFGPLFDLRRRGVFWVTRAEDNLQCRVVKCQQWRHKGNILRDELALLETARSKAEYPRVLRRVLAWVELDGEWVEMTFLTNHLEWSAQTMVDLDRYCGQIGVLSKQIKQALPLADFLGQSANAMHWPVWMAPLVSVRLRSLVCVAG